MARQEAMYSEEAPLWKRYEQACDFLEDDLESGYVRVLQEMIAAGWSNAEIAEKVRGDAAGLVRPAHRRGATGRRSASAASARSTRRKSPR